jgi:hypothetical protein
LVEHALQLAIRESSQAVKQTSIHDVHVRIGRRAFAKGDINLARRHLLSAAFGMPRNAECNFWLGEVYQQTGKLRRAWSRYFQALLDEKLEKEAPLRAQALERLTALNRDPEFRKDFNMIDAEEYMAGRLANSEFHAETRYRFVRNRHPHRARMAELFVDSSQELGGGMELAFQALAEFFDGELVLVSWHLDDPMHSEAARKRLAFYQKKSAPLVVIDGTTRFNEALGEGEKPAEDAARHYPLLRDACLPETAPDSAEWEISGDIRADGDRLKVGISVDGGGSSEGLQLVVVLCERSVMAVEGNGVFFITTWPASFSHPRTESPWARAEDTDRNRDRRGRTPQEKRILYRSPSYCRRLCATQWGLRHPRCQNLSPSRVPMILIPHLSARFQVALLLASLVSCAAVCHGGRHPRRPRAQPLPQGPGRNGP